MGLQDWIRNSYFAKAVALAAAVLVMWWGGLLSPVDGKIEKSYVTQARILEVHEQALMVRLADGRQARVYAPRARDHHVGDTVRLQIVRYQSGREDAMVSGR